ncbi:unnamed protein product [Echinostoma caproni]|uniref:ADK_lid domain-containing protein n=1 Tax=Echinostoma caproni TaxID=27848 RepID=A0A183APD5_9TREM|nr:unnamed protein product [Echinostoma caproni]
MNVHRYRRRGPRLTASLRAPLLTQKLLSRPCQNQGFVLDGFPKSLAQAEMLFRPDPDDEEAMGDEKHPGFHRLITPHHVIVLQGSNAYTYHRLYQQCEAAGIDPAKARIVPPPWPRGFRVDKSNTLGVLESTGLRNESAPDEDVPSVMGTRETEVGADEYDDQQKMYAQLETYLERYERRLEEYRAVMAPNAATLRKKLIAEAERAGTHSIICSLFVS